MIEGHKIRKPIRLLFNSAKMKVACSYLSRIVQHHTANNKLPEKIYKRAVNVIERLNAAL